MKKHAAFLLAGALTLGACSLPDTPTVDTDIEQSAAADTLEDTDTTENHFGFSTKVANPNDGEGENDNIAYKMNLQVAADAISRFSASLPGIENVSTVVTDEEVLISYQVAQDYDHEMDPNEMADQVKKNALSVIPRWYHVYVTDDPNLRVNVESIAQTHLNDGDMEDAIASTIKLMRESSPQGYPIDEGENANGETKDEENDMAEEDIDLAPAAMDIPAAKSLDA
ncbi:YhcN/YlaJ family sporulation lipoprotein [Jeotgalibacillus proteolyticus]|uniref:YhcN/YlaJ family sporulation lipoprotein n=1 Tax=Jeotgalibacillus proteolyticus TaxID=2082395 RepID=UPI003CF2125F